MRTTLTVDDDLLEALRTRAFETGKSLKEVVNETLRLGLHGMKAPRARRYRVKPASLGGVRPGVDLDKALRLADEMEDAEIARKLELRK